MLANEVVTKRLTNSKLMQKYAMAAVQKKNALKEKMGNAEIPDPEKLKNMKIDAPNPLKSARAAARLASKSSIFGGLGKMYEELEKEGLALETAEKEKEVVKKLATLGGGAKPAVNPRVLDAAADSGCSNEDGAGGREETGTEGSFVAGASLGISNDDLEEAFELLATDDVIGEDELAMLMVAIGEQPSEAEITHLLWEHGSVFEDSGEDDDDEEASLDFDEFLESRSERIGIWDAFSKYEVNGCISAAEAFHMLANEMPTQRYEMDKVAEIVRLADKEMNGVLGFEVLVAAIYETIEDKDADEAD